MWIIQEPNKVALWNKRHFEEKNGECAACLKYSVLIVVEKKKVYKMQHLEGSGTPVLYIGRTVLKGYSAPIIKLTAVGTILADTFITIHSSLCFITQTHKLWKFAKQLFVHNFWKYKHYFKWRLQVPCSRRCVERGKKTHTDVSEERTASIFTV